MTDSNVLALALVIDALIGDPPALYKRIPHPVALLGRLIDAGEQLLNRGAAPVRLVAGLLLTGLLVLLAFNIGELVGYILQEWSSGWLLEAVLVSALLAGRGLYDHVKAVAIGLRQSLAAGRAAVAHIVGRDPNSLDEAGVARAAVESAAENFSDGVVAPVMWYALLGLPGLCAYKAINTLDSMIGHRNRRFEHFGKVAARVDDLVNWPAARFAGLLLIAAAWLHPKADAARAWHSIRRDAHKHRSPNAGWPESAMAGALGFALAGPRRYGVQTINDHWMGNGRTVLTANDIDAALRLYCIAVGLLLLLVVLAGMF